MPKRKKYISLIILLIAVALIGFLTISAKKSSKNEMILFYGDTCPHCKKVSEYIEANNVRAKFNFQDITHIMKFVPSVTRLKGKLQGLISIDNKLNFKTDLQDIITI